MGRLSRAERWYGRLLHLYPKAYRERFGEEMRQVFCDLYRDQHQASAGWWWRLTTDAVFGAAREHVALMRSQDMKLYLSHSADQRVLVWGVGMMVPAGLFFVAAALGWLRSANLPLLHWPVPVITFLIAFLPVVAMVINMVALAKQAATRRVPMLSGQFVSRYFWTLALIVAAAGWLAFLFGHDTIGCAVQSLPRLDWAGYRQCLAVH